MVTSLLTIGANNSLRIGLFQLSIGHAAWSIRESTWSKSSGIFIHLVSLPLFNLTKLYPKNTISLKIPASQKDAYPLIWNWLVRIGYARGNDKKNFKVQVSSRLMRKISLWKKDASSDDSSQEFKSL